MTAIRALDTGRASFAGQLWGDAFAALSAAHHQAALEPDDLERLATAAYLLGKDAACVDTWALAHHECLRLGQAERAARCAFWLAFVLLNTGDMARGGGWLARAQRLLDEGQHDCVERGYLLLPSAIQLFGEDDLAAHAMFCGASEIGARFGDRDLMAMAAHGRGRTLIQLGRTAEGLAVLDEMMVSVTAGEVSPMVIGDAYCGVIEECQTMFDLRRAREWTAALGRWCDAQPDLVPYRGECLVYRAQIMQLSGAWQDAVDESHRALARPAAANPTVRGAAAYQRAEIHRLRGELSNADDAYRQASELGRQPEPGLAELRLAQGRIDAAVAMIQRAADETSDRMARARLLPAYVVIMLAANDVATARGGAEELSRIAAESGAPFLRAASRQAEGAVLLTEGDARAALAMLRRAWSDWQGLDAPYEGARVRVLVGSACRALGDEDTAQMEFDVARRVFQQLGAATDLARTEALSRIAADKSAGGLTSRELEVLRLVAAGKTNRGIGDELVISEKTVARHVSNIFTKLGLSSRSAATAYAYEHGLV